MKAVGYCRYSTDNQTENSIAYQLGEIQKYCSAHNLVMINTYMDEATTGTNTNREGLQRMLADAQLHVFDVVVIYDQSRLSRHILDWFNVRQALRKSDIALYSCTETLDNGESESGFLSEGVRALFNHQFVLDARAKTMAGQTSRAKQGAFLGGSPPLGYDIVDGKYVINEFEAQAVQMIFTLYLQGRGYGYIVEQLKVRGVKSKRGAIIGENALYAILRNERYAGIYTWMKTKEKYLQKWAGGKLNANMIRIESGVIPPIISMEVWNEVKTKIAIRKERAQNAACHAKTEYLLSGLIRCGNCGSTFIGYTTTSSKGYRTRYYGCSGKRRLHNCKAPSINANELETLIIGQVERDILNNVIIERVADDILSMFKDNSGDSSRIKKEISECEHGISNLLTAIQKGLSGEIAFQRIDELNIKKATLETQLSQFVAEVPSKANIIKVLRQDVKLLETDRTANIKAILHKYITSITITEDSVIINCLGDLVDKTKKVTSPDESEDVTKYGCGGQI